MKEKNKGITLIALIITIIVMLILVAVSVKILIDSNIIGNAQSAAEQTKTAYEQEGQMGEITVDGKKYASAQDYVDNKETIQVTASQIAGATQKTDYYGKRVEGLTLDNGDTETKWRILYADSENIYLIAEDYVNITEYGPKELLTKGDSDYCYNFTATQNINKYKTGSESEVFGEGKVGKTLLNTYLTYLKTNTLTNNNLNMVATALLLDADAWNGFTDSAQSDENQYIKYAVGAPTMEILLSTFRSITESNPALTFSQNCFKIENTFYFGYDETKGLFMLPYREREYGSPNEGYWIASPGFDMENNYNCVWGAGLSSGSVDSRFLALLRK